MSLSDQLNDLASRTKQLEDTVAAGEAQDKDKLQKERDKLHAEMQSEVGKIQSTAGKAKIAGASWWADLTARAEQDRQEHHVRAAERQIDKAMGQADEKLEREMRTDKVDKALHYADDAESYAANLMLVAAYCVDAAEYAFADAVIARVDADAMAATS